jgi:hypothetical protein
VRFCRLKIQLRLENIYLETAFGFLPFSYCKGKIKKSETVLKKAKTFIVPLLILCGFFRGGLIVFFVQHPVVYVQVAGWF